MHRARWALGAMVVGMALYACSVVTDLSGLAGGCDSGSCADGGGDVASGDGASDGANDGALEAGPPPATCLWSHRYGDPMEQYAGQVAVGPSGDVFVSESFAGTIDFGGGPLTSAGGLDLGFAHLNRDGSYVAARRFGDSAEQSATGIAINGIGDVFVTGPFKGTLDFGDGGAGVLTDNADGLYDVFLVQLRNEVPIAAALGTGPGSQFSYDLVADPSRGALVTGVNQGSLTIAGKTLPVSSGATSAAFAAHLLSNQDWAEGFPSSATAGINASAYDSAGNIVAVGSFSGTAQLGGAPLTSAGGLDAFVAKYDALGNFLWRDGFGNANDDQAVAVATRGTDVIVTGMFSGTITIGAGSLTSAGSNDIFVVVIDKNGNVTQSWRFGGIAEDDARAIAVDAAGDVYLGGFVYGDVDFGGGVLKNAGGTDIFLLALDPSGKHLWSRLYGDSADQNLYFDGLAISPDGTLVITPEFHGTVDFGCGPLTSAGTDDLAVAKITR